VLNGHVVVFILGLPLDCALQTGHDGVAEGHRGRGGARDFRLGLEVSSELPNSLQQLMN
jgi:hypothetical protein